MTGSLPLTIAPEPPRKRGRPKGSTNRRAADLKGYIGARFGGSAAQQSAQLCMVTPAELKKAGGSMAAAMVMKAQDLVNHVRQAQDGLDARLRELVRAEVEFLLLDAKEGATSREIRAGLAQAIKRAVDGSGGFGLRDALKLLADERAALLPYTDQRQPLAVDLTGKGMAPSVVVMGSGLGDAVPTMAVENTEVFEGVFEVVSQPKSHDEGQGVEPPDLFGLPPAD
ncbi:MAG: hypothetical protein DI570_09245 [Phenylobacterium zucineum]|nr:MAG: hypothetical protein DI570_09245 [Phenylobacterium zucineum]